MSETILAAFIGALVGGLLTQLTLFWLTNKKEKKLRRRLAIEHTTRAMIGLEAATFLHTGRSMVEADLDKIMAMAIEKVDNYSDDEISAVSAISQWTAEYTNLMTQRIVAEADFDTETTEPEQDETKSPSSSADRYPGHSAANSE